MDAIKKSAQTISELIWNGCNIALVHGAGSFGHARAKKWKLSEGKINENFTSDGEIKSQDEAVIQVRKDMIKLNQLIQNELKILGVKYKVYHPHNWALGTGIEFKGDLDFLDSDALCIVHGDVVDDSEQEFGILSGDDIMYRIATEWNGVDSCVFALADCDGIMTHPPDDERAILINNWDPSMGFGSVHDADHDVTGGIEYKVLRASQIAKSKGKETEVWFVDGRKPERIFDACMGGEPIGTKIHSKPVRL